MNNKKMRILSLSLLASAGLYAGQSFAGGMPMDFYPSVKPVFSIAGGIGETSIGENQQITVSNGTPLVPVQTNYGYVPDGKTSTSGFGQVFVGARWNYSPSVSFQGGIVGFYYSPFKTSGIGSFTGLDGSRDFSYNYKIKSMGIMLELKSIWNLGQHWHPFFNAAAGFSENESEDFSQSSLVAGLTPIPGSFYGNKSVTEFAYMLGAGVNYSINQNFELGVGYEYVDLGKAELAPGAGQATSQALSTKEIRVNQGYISLSYVGTGEIV